MHPAIIIGTVRSMWTWLWGRYHVPQNVFLVYNQISHLKNSRIYPSLVIKAINCISWQTARNFFEWITAPPLTELRLHSRLVRQQLYWQDQQVLQMPAWILLWFTILPCLGVMMGSRQGRSFGLNQTTSRRWRTSRSCSQYRMNKCLRKSVLNFVKRQQA